MTPYERELMKQAALKRYIGERAIATAQKCFVVDVQWTDWDRKFLKVNRIAAD